MHNKDFFFFFFLLLFLLVVRQLQNKFNLIGNFDMIIQVYSV